MSKSVAKGLAALLLCALVAAAAQADTGPSIITGNVVQINEYTSPQGFKHPGIRFTKQSLDNMRAQVIAGREPWASYFEGMRRLRWAQLTYTSGNDNGSGLPRNPVIDNNGKVSTFIEDAQAALIHSVMYVVTGDERHRALAMRMVNIYSHMSPTGVNYFADVHIKMGQPIYHMTAAAEILRTTSALTPSLQWTQEMTDNYVNNFLTPQLNAYIRKNHYFMNQFSYALIGNTAAAIFSDDVSGYEQAVEWATVNASAENQGWNGSIKRVFRWMDQNDATGEPVSPPRVQLAEMGRDQPHAIGNVDSLFIISQIISSQGTRVDPSTGTISTASNAVPPVHFNDDALLKGYIEFIKYNFGEDIQWTPMASSILADGTFDSIYRRVIAQQRGRLLANAYLAVYHYFQHTAGYDLTRGENRYVSLVYEKNKLAYSQDIRSGAYWGPREHVYDSEFWMHLPAASADNSAPLRGEPREMLDPLPPAPPAGITDFESRYYIVTGQGQTQTDGDITYVSVQASNAQPTNFTLWYFFPSDGRNAIRLRSNGPATIEFTRGASLPASSYMHVPNTGGEWQYIAFDRTKQDVGGSGDVTFFRVIGHSSVLTTVDFDHMNTDGGAVRAPLFTNGSPVAALGATTYIGGTLQRSFAATTTAGTSLQYRGEGLPAGASVNSSTGAFSWLPANGQTGTHRFYVIAGDGIYQSSYEVVLNVLANVSAAVSSIAQTRVPGQEYESATLGAFEAAHAVVEAAVRNGASSSEIDVALAQFTAAAGGLRVLSAEIGEDIANDELGAEPEGARLNYPALVAATNTPLGALVDGDASSFNSRWEDQAVILDFGAKYRVIPKALHIQTRQGFPDRVRGGHLLASDDNVNWVQITAQAGYGEQMQRLPVFAEHRDRAYRFLKVYAAPPVCNCPVFDLGELYLFGYRKEVNEAVIAPSRWLVGETLSLQFDTQDPQGNPTPLSAELPQGAQLDTTTGRLAWTPSASQIGEQRLTVTADYGYTRVVTPFTIKVSATANTAVDEILAELGPTDGYTQLSVGTLNKAIADARVVAGNSDFGVYRKLEYLGLLEKAVGLLKPISSRIDTLNNAAILASHHQWNTPSVGATLSGRPAFDGNAATFVDLQAGNGYWVQADFGEGRYVTLREVSLTPRSNLALRLNGASITGSNDGVTWTTLATLPNDAYSSDATTTPSILLVSDTSPYRYLRFNGSSTSSGNVSEVVFVGRTSFEFDDTTLKYLIAKAGIQRASEYTQASWLALSEVLTLSNMAATRAPLDPEEVADVTEALDTALNELVPLKGSIHILAQQVGKENGGFVTCTVTRSGGSFGRASVRYETADGSANAGEDYQSLNGQLNWADREEGTKEVAIALINDGYYEDSEQLVVKLSDAYGAQLGSATSASLTIADDDVNALPGLSVGNASMLEGSWLSTLLGQNRMKFEIKLSGQSKKRVTAGLITSDGSARALHDYIPLIGVVSFAPGEIHKTVEVLIVPDRAKEANETMKLKAQGAVNAKLRQATGTGTILDDD
jgi:Calx-beta domain/F5/8 type C domain/Putative Ig domain